MEGGGKKGERRKRWKNREKGGKRGKERDKKRKRGFM